MQSVLLFVCVCIDCLLSCFLGVRLCWPKNSNLNRIWAGMWKACGLAFSLCTRNLAKSIRYETIRCKRQCSANSPTDTGCIQFVVYLLACLATPRPKESEKERERFVSTAASWIFGLLLSWPGFKPYHWHRYLHICWVLCISPTYSLSSYLYLVSILIC